MTGSKLTVSGYRGVWGKTFTPDIAREFTNAFADFVLERRGGSPTILVAIDGRESGLEVKGIVIETLLSMGINVIDGNILPTPVVLFAVRTEKYDGAIIITASHNPIEYNGLKFVTEKALFADESEVQQIIKLFDSTHKKKTGGGTVSGNISIAQKYISQIVSSVDTRGIRAKRFKVAVDMINASACIIDPALFDSLGVELVPLNNIPNGKFAHVPEPVKENLSDIAVLVKESGADIGFAHDPDADRLVVVDENGNVLSEEYTLALCVEAVMSKFQKETVVINMSTSQMNVDIAEKYGGKCVRTKVGEANVVDGILKNKAIIGGEGGGGIIYPKINLARDSFVSMALVLELCADGGVSISKVVSSLPQYKMRKDKVSRTGDLAKIYEKMKIRFDGDILNELDGLRIDFDDRSWIHLRPSNTEPIIRLIGEAKSDERLDYIFNETKQLLA